MSARAKSPPGKASAGAKPGSAGGGGDEAKLRAAQAELVKESELRNYAQLEKDKLLQFWELTKAELAEARATLRLQARAAEEAADEADDRLRAVTVRMKHMAHEHAATVAALQLDRETALKVAQDEFRRVEEQLIEEKREVVASLYAAEAASSTAVHSVRLESAREGTALRNALEEDAATQRVAASAAVAADRAASDARRHGELEAAGCRREAQVAALGAAHVASLAEVKRFFDETSDEQLATIKRLKEETAELRRREASLEASVAELSLQVRALTDALAHSTKEADTLRPLAATVEKDRGSATAATARALKADANLKNVEWELEVKTQLAQALKAERDELQKALDTAEASARRPGRMLSSSSGPGVPMPTTPAVSAMR